MIRISKYSGGDLFYSDSGEGNVMVFLHGYLESSEVWKSITNDLERSARVIAIDLPGHGKSSVFSSEHTMEFMARAVKNILDENSIEKIMLIGHSLGGYVALAFLELFPERLQCYCLFHSHPVADTDDIIKNRQREIKVVESGKKDIIYPVNVSRMFADKNLDKFRNELEFMKEIASNTPGEGIVAVLNGMIRRPSRLNLLEKGDVPLLLILGLYDNYIPHQRFSNLKLPLNGQMVTLRKSGHLGFIEEREKTISTLIKFFRENF